MICITVCKCCGNKVEKEAEHFDEFVHLCDECIEFYRSEGWTIPDTTTSLALPFRSTVRCTPSIFNDTLKKLEEYYVR